MSKRIITLAVSVFLAACGGSSTPEPVMIVEDIEARAFVDDNDNGMVSDDTPRTIKLSDYFAENRPGTKIIMLNAAAGWCGPCQSEASAMREFDAAYAPRGVAILTAVFQRADGTAADDEFARLWCENFTLSIPTIIDTDFVTRKYFDERTMPSNLFVDAETKEVLKVVVGMEDGPDPMRAYRELLDDYLTLRF
jgi:thiol-disulfide isomerase/thioredoxin